MRSRGRVLATTAPQITKSRQATQGKKETVLPPVQTQSPLRPSKTQGPPSRERSQTPSRMNTHKPLGPDRDPGNDTADNLIAVPVGKQKFAAKSARGNKGGRRIQELVSEADQVRHLFQRRASILKSWLRFSGLPPEMQGVPLANVLRTEVVAAEPPSDFFHFHPRECWFAFSQRFCEVWNRHTRSKGLDGLDREGVFDTFLVHEWSHLSHGLTSDKYSDVPDYSNGLRRLDYLADAISIEACGRLYRGFLPSRWSSAGPTLQARVIRMAITNMETSMRLDEIPPRGNVGRAF